MQKPWKFSYETVDRATNGFNNSNVLGRGLTGVVYRRVMPCTHKQVAAKVILHNNDFGEDQYRTEITTLGRISHQNAVPLRGYSKSKNKLILVYDFMPKGSLDKYLYGNAQSTLDWGQRFLIIKQIANVLLFVHQQFNQMVVDKDIKASSILLDADYNAKLGNFGFSGWCNFGAEGTWPVEIMGYICPEGCDGLWG